MSTGALERRSLWHGDGRSRTGRAVSGTKAIARLEPPLGRYLRIGGVQRRKPLGRDLDELLRHPPGYQPVRVRLLHQSAVMALHRLVIRGRLDAEHQIGIAFCARMPRQHLPEGEVIEFEDLRDPPQVGDLGIVQHSVSLGDMEQAVEYVLADLAIAGKKAREPRCIDRKSTRLN